MNSNVLPLLLFDLDGTLWDSSENIARAWNEVTARELPEAAPFTAADIRSIMGLTGPEIVLKLAPELPPERKRPVFAHCERFETGYIREHGGVLFPQVRETLAGLKAAGYRMAVISNCQTDYVPAFMQSMGTGEYFCDYEEYERTGLTKAENIRLVMKRQGSSEAVYIGDTAKDREAAKEAGIPFIHAAYGFGTADAPSGVIRSFAELPAALTQLGMSGISEKPDLPFDFEEALRYMGMKNASAEVRSEAAEKAAQLTEGLSPHYIYRILPLIKTDEGFLLGELAVNGASASRMLKGCSRAALLISTLGFAFENRLRTVSARNMADAVILDACGSALAERGCDEAEKAISAACPGEYLTDRFSPGYGDLPLSLQAEICRITDAEKLLGVHLHESMLLFPSKTVTAIVGIAASPQPARIRGCSFCTLANNCSFRKEGSHCEQTR